MPDSGTKKKIWSFGVEKTFTLLKLRIFLTEQLGVLEAHVFGFPDPKFGEVFDSLGH